MNPSLLWTVLLLLLTEASSAPQGSSPSPEEDTAAVTVQDGVREPSTVRSSTNSSISSSTSFTSSSISSSTSSSAVNSTTSSSNSSISSSISFISSSTSFTSSFTTSFTTSSTGDAQDDTEPSRRPPSSTDTMVTSRPRPSGSVSEAAPPTEQPRSVNTTASSEPRSTSRSGVSSDPITFSADTSTPPLRPSTAVEPGADLHSSAPASTSEAPWPTSAGSQRSSTSNTEPPGSSSADVRISTAFSSTSSGGALIFAVTRTPPSTKSSTMVTSSGPPPCSTRSMAKFCLLIITALAVLATIFMVSTVVLCAKLSERKYKLKRRRRQDTELMCISTLLPERTCSKPARRKPVTNGVLVIPGDGDGHEDTNSSDDNITLSSFLPDHDRL